MTMLKGLVNKIIGDPNAKEIKRVQPLVEEINAPRAGNAGTV